MKLSHEQLITLQSVKGCGTTTINKIASAALSLPSRHLNLRELYDYIGELISSRMVSRFKLPMFSEFEVANVAARRILDRSYRQGINIVSQFEEDFPEALRHTIDEEGKSSNPILLYYKGDISVAHQTSIAIIGTREPTNEGVQAGEYFGKVLAEHGANIVSGLAIGCDSAGHRGALKGKGATTAFLAHGLDSVYPSENESLAEAIVCNGGLLMSEYEIGKTVNRYNLVARDRLQASLSSATIVVQTGRVGGTMHAVNVTIKSGKPLYAVTYHDVHSDKVAGNSYLIDSKGAIPLTSKSDIQSLFFSKEEKQKMDLNKASSQGLLFNPDEL